MELRTYTLDVFTESLFGGNPLAVVFGGEALDSRQMQLIAREFNLSETVFVLPATRPDCLHRVRIFTPTKELPFAGHPTVGTACLLAELHLAPSDQAFLLEENVGPVPVRVRREPDRALYAELTTAKLPEFGPPPPDAAALASLLGLQAEDIGRPGEAPRAVSCGVPFLLVPLRAPELLAAIEVDSARCKAVLGGYWAQELFVYTHGYEGELRARMFAPNLGIAEDPATGSAAAALAGALGQEAGGEGRLDWTLHQGVEMGRPSQLQLSVDRRGGQVSAIRVGGHAIRVSEGLLRLP